MPTHLLASLSTYHFDMRRLKQYTIIHAQIAIYEISSN